MLFLFSISATRQESKETQTIMTLPSKLQVCIPVHCATIKAINSGRKPEGDDEKLTLVVSVIDVSTGKPLKSIIALDGDSRAPSNGQVVCFLSFSVNVVGNSQLSKHLSSKGNTEPTHNIWRSKRSAYAANGQATFYMSFYEEDANYIVTVDINTVLDEEGIQCIGYKVEHYTGFISTIKTVERSAFRAPPLLKYEGDLASSKFNNLMSVYNKMFYEGRMDKSNMIMSKMTSSDSTAALDVKLYMSISRATEKSLAPGTAMQLEEILEKTQSLDSPNGFLLEALIMIALSQVHSLQGGEKKALECIYRSRSICLEAAPSHLTSCVFFTDARNMISVNKGNLTSGIKRRILELFDRAIADSYYGVGWERQMIFNSHVYKALFCLNGIIDLRSPLTTEYVPTSEDISIAEQHLNAAPLDIVCEIHRHIVHYYIARSDLHKWKKNIPEAREYLEKAKHLCIDKSYYLSMVPLLDARLQLLKPDTIDEILEMFKNDA